MKRCVRVGLSVFAALVFAITSISFAGEKWNVEDLGQIGYETTIVDMNDAGTVVGTFRSSGGLHAFVMQNGVITDLGPNGEQWSEAIAVNKSGQVVVNVPFRKAFFWDKGEMIDLGTLGGLNTVATAMNDSGEVVGYSETEAGVRHAFIWKNGIIADLGTLPGGSSSFATAINNAGEVVGLSTTAASCCTYNVFKWNKGNFQDLGESPMVATQGLDYAWIDAPSINKKGEIAALAGMYPRSFVFSKGTWTRTADPNSEYYFALNFLATLNDKGVFAGTYFNLEGSILAFIWKDGEPTYINPPEKEYEAAPGYIIKDNVTDIYDMNNKGQAVGSSFNPYGNPRHAIEWEKGVTTLLPTLFGDESRAHAINKKGQIVGMNGDHMVLWTRK